MFESFKHYWKYRKPKLDDALQAQVSKVLRHVPTNHLIELQAALDGGKKIRGILLGVIAEDLGGEWGAAISRSVAIELIQAASLIHDDFVDQDRMRRNMPAVWTLEGARKAVLMGDVIFASAIHMMNRIGRDDGLVVSRAIAQISRGALMEPNDPLTFMEQITSQEGSGDSYKKIIHLKTGVLFEAACELGALSAGADEKIRDTCRQYGSYIGEAYQMADDIKEIKQHLLQRHISSHQMALLAPAILYFSEEAFPHIPPILNGSSVEIAPPFWECLRSTMHLMEMEIRDRLALAVKEIREVLREKSNSSLCLRAPAEIIAMFNLS